MNSEDERRMGMYEVHFRGGRSGGLWNGLLSGEEIRNSCVVTGETICNMN